jgi:hypothetical protein
MTNEAATFLYRREVARAIARYRAALRQIFAAHGSPIPPTFECAGAMGDAWGTCRVAFKQADQRLAARRICDTTAGEMIISNIVGD